MRAVTPQKPSHRAAPQPSFNSVVNQEGKQGKTKTNPNVLTGGWKDQYYLNFCIQVIFFPENLVVSVRKAFKNLV